MRNNNHPDLNHIELWHRITSFIVFSVMMLNLMIPFSISAATIIDKSFFSTELASGQYYEPAYTGDFLYKKSSLINTTAKTIPYSIADFFKELANVKSPALPAKVLVPVQVGDITIFVPINKLGKLAGDAEVQARLIRSQIYNVFSRNTIQAGFTEAQQIGALYANSALLAAQGGVTFGKEISESQANNFGKDFIWPVEMTLNGQSVLVPQLYLSDATVKDFTLKGHLVEFHGTTAEFHHINIGAGALVDVRNNYLKASGNFNLGENARIVGENDVNLIVHGTLQNLSGTITASKNINILAGQLISKRVVHRFDTGQYQGTRLGEVAGYLANGHIQIRTYGDMQFESSVLNAGGSIQLKADGNIRIAAQQESIVGGRAVGGYRSTDSAFAYLGSSLTAKDSVFLMASGAIEINASTIHADSGVIQLLAQQGVYIGNEMNQFQQSRQGKLGKVTEQEQQLQTMAVRSALNAGKGVLIATELGDITLKATSIKAGQGTEVSARNGKLNLLLAKEQDEYFYNKVKKGTWKIKTETKQDQTDTAVYNAIVGGVKVHASRGVTLELAQKEGQSISQVMSDMAATTDLAWMNTLYNDPQFAGNIDLAYQTLQDLHLHKKTSNLSPAAMAVIAIAVAVAMGPAGAGWIGTGEGAIAAKGFVNAAAMQAGAVTLATQAATGLASGKGLGGTLESMVQEDSIRSLAISMVTAGVLDHFGKTLNQDFFGTVPTTEALTAQQQMISFANQAAQTLARTTVSAGISNIINGGSFKEFTASMKASLYQAGVMAVGKHMAQSVGKAYRDGDINQAVRYLSHAGAGCIIGLASKGTGGTQGSGSESCLTGSVGAVTGELVADTYKAKKLTEIFNQHKTELDALKSSNGWTQQQLEAYVLSAPMQNKINYQIQQMTAAGVDLAKLSGALSALAGGGDVNLAAMTAENAAQNNAFFLIPLAVMLLKGIDLALTANELWGIYQKMQTSEAEGNAALQQWLQEQIEGKLIEKAIPGFKTFDELLDWCRKNNVLSMQMVEQVKDHLKTKLGPDAGPPKVTVLDTKHTKLNLNNVTGETNMITGKELELTHLPSGKKVKNDGILGEQVAAQVLTEATGITFHGHIKNKSNNGPDLLAVNPDTSKKEIFLIEVKSSTEKNYPNPDKLDLVSRGVRWIEDAATGKLNQQDLTPEAVAYAKQLKTLIRDGYTIKPFMAKVGVPHEGQAGTARVTVVPAK